MYQRTNNSGQSRGQFNRQSNSGSNNRSDFRRGNRQFSRGGGRRPKYQAPDTSDLILSFIDKTNRELAKSDRQQPAMAEQQPVEIVKPFSDYQLHPSLQANIDHLGFTTPTPIQTGSLELILNRQNVLGLANTGTGKTGAFLIPLVHQLLSQQAEQVLVIAPTRELAVQIFTVFRDLTHNTNLRAVACIGGGNINRQIQQLRRSHQVIIGTPGRILDLMERRQLSVRNVSAVVLDEVDRMLDMGFVHDIKKILSQTPADKQSLYFSATINPRVSELINQFSGAVTTVSVQQADAKKSVLHEIVRYRAEDLKFETLHDLLSSEVVVKSVIFGRTKHGVRKLAEQLQRRGFQAESIHGNKTQGQRQRALDSFRSSHSTILVATDVAARGIDVDDVSHVINYDLPQSLDDYIHRTGRTGRAGKTGIAYTFLK